MTLLSTRHYYKTFAEYLHGQSDPLSCSCSSTPFHSLIPFGLLWGRCNEWYSLAQSVGKERHVEQTIVFQLLWILDSYCYIISKPLLKDCKVYLVEHLCYNKFVHVQISVSSCWMDEKFIITWALMEYASYRAQVSNIKLSLRLC